MLIMNKDYLMKYLILALLTFGQHAMSLPEHDPVPGGIALVPLTTDSNTMFDGRLVMINESEGGYVAVVGIPLSQSPGSFHLDTEEGKVHFNVKEKQYEEQRLTIGNKRKVNPYAQDMDRITRERAEINAAFSNFRQISRPETNFELPTKGVVSSSFGLRRILNDQPRSPHSGMDIAAPEGTSIHSPAAGKIIATGDYFFNGNTVMVDHGQGLITMYCHMSSISVEIGQTIDKRQYLGDVGKTGRVTGAHLHWSVSLNNARVNPNLFLTQGNTP
jgi:murein DD-endopeptidase MepM/ murein hydrolase activator NlpD